jgi:DNA-binding Lrp family transcriptional regulator
MDEPAQRICELAQASAAADDADTALRAVTELRAEIDAFVRIQVGRALAAGRSFSDVARPLGISRQAAHRRFRDLAPKGRVERKHALVATEAARRAVRIARAEAYADGTTPGSEHVLLGVLRTDCDASRALRFDGVTPERARACLQSTRAGHDAGSMPRILKQAARVVLSRGDREVDIDELLLAALADPDGGATRTLTALAVEPTSVRKRLGHRSR